MDQLLEPAGIDRLREALTSADYTSTGIAERIGARAGAALARNDARAAMLAVESADDPLATLIRLFVCCQTEPVAAVTAALAPLGLAEAVEAGLVEPAALPGDAVGLRAGVDLKAYRQWWVLADPPAAMRQGLPLPAEHVLGVGGASTTLAGATVRRPVASALDLGTGCGVQSLHLSEHATSVTATDLSERALRFASTTAALNGYSWELLAGDMVAPVSGRRFDLVVSNPPFVVGSGTRTHTYRDSGRPGDAVCAELAAAAPRLLNHGGTMQFLANWVHVAGQDWHERVAGWVAGTGLDAWIVQREVSDPRSYVDLWLSDAAEDPATRMRRTVEWLDWFDAAGVEAVGLGLVTLRNSGHDDPHLRVEDLRQGLGAPLGELVGSWFDRMAWLRQYPGQRLLEARLRLADGMVLEQSATRADGEWAVATQSLRLTDGLRWNEEVDPVTLAIVNGCDGGLRLRDVLDLLAAAHEVDLETLADVAVEVVAHLVERGVLLPVEGSR